MRRNFGGKGSGLYFSDVFNARHLSIGNFPPRLKFNGFVEFFINPDLKAQAIEIGVDAMRNDLAGFTFETTLPKLNFKTETYNQYNIKRVVQTGVELQPVSMQLYDTVTNDWYEMLMTYYAYNYMNPRQAGKTSSVAGGPATPSGSDTWTRESKFKSNSFPSNASGFDANDTPHLFDAIRMVVVNGQQGREIVLHRPVITEMDFGEIDHAGNEPNIFQVTFDYENFVVGSVIENPLDELDIEKFSIYGVGNHTDTLVDTNDTVENNSPYRQKVGKPMKAAELLNATRRSQPQPEAVKKEETNPGQAPQQRGRLGGTF